MFRCSANYHIDDCILEPKSKKEMFVGYESEVKDFIIWLKSKGLMIVHRDIMFDEVPLTMYEMTLRETFE